MVVLPVWRSPLSSADRNHGVDCLDAGLQRLMHGFSRDDAGRDLFNRHGLFRQDRTLAVNRLTERIDDSAEQLLTDRNRHDLLGTLDARAFLDIVIGAEQNGTDKVVLEVERHAGDAAFKFQQLAGHALLQSVHVGNAVTDGDYRTDIGKIQLRFIVFQLLLDDTGNFIWS